MKFIADIPIMGKPAHNYTPCPFCKLKEYDKIAGIFL